MPPGPRRRFEPELREALVRYVRERLAEGAAKTTVAAELGVSTPTVARLGAEAPSLALVPVRIVEAADDQHRRLTVRAPGGLVIEGLDVLGVAALVKAVNA